MKTILAAAVIVTGIDWAPALAQMKFSTATYCDDQRAAGLTRQIRDGARELDIDWNIACELRGEVDPTAALERHYCATGMTAWRAGKLDRQYAQIGEELRVESLS